MTTVIAYGAELGGSTAHMQELISRVRELLAMAPLDARSTSVYVLTQAAPGSRSIAELGWSKEDAWRVRQSMASFAEDWDAPGMDAYDDL